MSDKGKIELKLRPEGETKAYVEGFSSAVNKFIWWLKEEPVEQATKTMLQISGALKSAVMEDTVAEISAVPTEEIVYYTHDVEEECSTCEYFLSTLADDLGYCKRFDRTARHPKAIGCSLYKPKQ